VPRLLLPLRLLLLLVVLVVVVKVTMLMTTRPCTDTLHAVTHRALL